jgi:hypothetical protein
MSNPVITVPRAQKPIDVSAEDFLMAIFPENAKGCIAITNVARDYHYSWRWVPGMDLSGPSYACISTLSGVPPRLKEGKPPHRPERISREQKECVETWCFYLDDVGTAPNSKVAPERIKLPPSWRLETSPGNFQWGYVFKGAVSPDRVRALVEALAAVGLTDPGAHSANRIMRLPGSIKPSNGFAAVLHEWEPDRVYTFPEVCQGLGVTPTDTPALAAVRETLLPGEADGTLKWLHDAGMVLSGGPNDRGFWEIPCPNADQHTTPGETAGYKPGIPGHFHCHHGHCKTLTTAVFSKWILEQDPDADLSPIPAGELKAIGKKLAGVLQPMETPDGAFIAGEAKAIAETVLADLVHIASEDRYWSEETRGLLRSSAVDTRWRARMLKAGLLSTTTSAGNPSKVLLTPTGWISRFEHMQKADKLIHRLGAPRIVDNCLNIAPALPKRLEVEGVPEPWLDLVEFICKDVTADSEVLLDWFAMVVTAWDEKPGWHIVLRGRQGTGKNLVLLPLIAYLKPDHHQDVRAVNLDQRFNSFLTKRLISVDELKMNTRGATTGHDIYQTLKAWTARGVDLISVEYKRQEPIDVFNLSGWVLTSNEGVPLPIENDDRRFMVIETPSEPETKPWYRRIDKWLKREGGNAMVVSWLHKRWDAMSEERRQVLREAPPMTEAKRELIDDGASGLVGAMQLALSGRHEVRWPDLMQYADIKDRLELKDRDLLSEGVRKNMNRAQILAALRTVGARRLFVDKDGVATPIRGCGQQVRLWCMRECEAHKYERMGQTELLVQTYLDQQKPSAARASDSEGEKSASTSEVVELRPKK